MKTKNPIIAFILSLILPGAGHIYAGRLAIGVIFSIIGIAIGLSIRWLGTSVNMLYVIPAIYSIWALLTGILAARAAKNSESDNPTASFAIALPYAVLILAGSLYWLQLPAAGTLFITQMTNSSMYPLFNKGEQLVVQETDELAVGDVAVVAYPRPYFSMVMDADRVIAMPGDVVELKENRCYVNGQLAEPSPELLSFNYSIYIQKDAEVSLETWPKYGLSGAGPRPGGYIITATDAIAAQIVSENDWALRAEARKADTSRVNNRLFTGAVDGWNENQMGPFRVPKAGETVQLDSANRKLYRRTMLLEDSNLEWRENQVLRNGKPITEYTFKEDAYWLMSDSRDNGFDSRLWGFIPKSFIMGKALYLWKNSQPDRFGTPLTLEK